MDSTNFQPQRSPSLWALALSTALVAIGFRRRDEASFPLEREDGRTGKTEADAPERGWIEVLQRVYERFSEDRVMSIAGGVTFFVLLAIFPAIAALVSIYGLFADPASLTGQIDRLSDIPPGGAIEVVGDQMRLVSSQGGTRSPRSSLLMSEGGQMLATEPFVCRATRSSGSPRNSRATIAILR